MHQRAKYYRDQQCFTAPSCNYMLILHKGQSLTWKLQAGLVCTPIVNAHAATQPALERCMQTHTNSLALPTLTNLQVQKFLDELLVHTGLRTTVFISCTSKGGIPSVLQNCNTLLI